MYSRIGLVVFEFLWVVNGIFETVLLIVDVWFDMKEPEVVKSKERRVVPRLGNVTVDTIWVEVSVFKAAGKLDE